jgi:outer membrane protein assembly factor BamD
LWVCAGCASSPQIHKPVSNQESAEKNFIQGKKAFEKGKYLDAIKLFENIKNNFPYSQYASEAHLLLAHSYFEQKDFLEAAMLYTNFVKLHPTHPMVPFVSFRIGVCYFERIPHSWWFAPPDYELDQKQVIEAIHKFEDYILRFPNHENVPAAQEKIRKSKYRLAEHEYYLMKFNYKRGYFQGTVWRADTLLKMYAGIGFDEGTLMYKARALAKLGQNTRAQSVVQELLKRFPESEYTTIAESLLAKLKQAEHEK